MISYEKEYQNSRNVCGELFPEIVEFFVNYDDESATVIDLGYRQGRNALFIARKGHSDDFKSVPKFWNIIKNEKNFFFAHKLALRK